MSEAYDAHARAALSLYHSGEGVHAAASEHDTWGWLKKYPLLGNFMKFENFGRWLKACLSSTDCALVVLNAIRFAGQLEESAAHSRQALRLLPDSRSYINLGA